MQDPRRAPGRQRQVTANRGGGGRVQHRVMAGRGHPPHPPGGGHLPHKTAGGHLPHVTGGGHAPLVAGGSQQMAGGVQQPQLPGSGGHHQMPGGYLQQPQWPSDTQLPWTGDGTNLQTAAGDELDMPSGPPMAAVPGGSFDSSAHFEHGGNDDSTVNDEGSLWSWGYNLYGQLGYGDQNSLFPCLVEQFQDLDPPETLDAEAQSIRDRTSLKLSSVKAGGMMSFAIDSLGSLWMWGNCPQQTDAGEFCIASSAVPLPVWDFHGHTVVKVACGNDHVVAAVSAGETYTGGDLVCYAWGNNSHGQLGLGDRESRSRPVLISAFSEESSWEVYEIACGASHTAVLTNKKSFDQIESRCWTFGLGDKGQLGHGTTATICSPQPVDGLPTGSFLISLDCGLFHTTVVSSDGEVWCWGMERGLGLCPDASYSGVDAGDALCPIRVQSPETNGFKFLGPVQIACGAAHTVLVAGDGYKMWAWGRGRSGVLGRGQTADSYIPCVVMWPPLGENFHEIHENQIEASTSGVNDRTSTELDQKLSAASDELQFLRSKLTLMERYANILHISIFRKPLDERTLPRSLQESHVFDIRKEFENILDAADTDELNRLEIFYRSMLSGVKDKLLKRRVQEMVQQCIISLSAGRQTPQDQ